MTRLYRPDDDGADTALTIEVLRRCGLRAGDRFVCLDVEAAALHDFYLRAARAAGARRTEYIHLTAEIAESVAPLVRLGPGLMLSVPTILAYAWPALSQLWPPGGCPIRCVLLIGEATSASLRAMIETAWGCEVISFYGTTETGGIGAECAVQGWSSRRRDDQCPNACRTSPPRPGDGRGRADGHHAGAAHTPSVEVPRRRHRPDLDGMLPLW